MSNQLLKTKTVGLWLCLIVFCWAQNAFGLEGPSVEDTGQEFIPEEHKSPEAKEGVSCVQVKKARIVFLNKTTAQRQILTINAEETIEQWSLIVRVIECWKVLDPLQSDDLVMVEVTEKNLSHEKKPIFLGWLSRSNPGYTTLEHYSYSMAVIECFND